MIRGFIVGAAAAILALHGGLVVAAKADEGSYFGCISLQDLFVSTEVMLSEPSGSKEGKWFSEQYNCRHYEIGAQDYSRDQPIDELRMQFEEDSPEIVIPIYQIEIDEKVVYIVATLPSDQMPAHLAVASVD